MDKGGALEKFEEADSLYLKGDYRAALDEHELAYSLQMYQGSGHGFHNDTSQARYNEAAAKLAWQRTLNFFNHYLER